MAIIALTERYNEVQTRFEEAPATVKARCLLAETLNEVGQALSGTLELSEVLNLILKHLAHMVQYNRAGVMLCNGDVLEFVAASGFPPEAQPSRIRISIGESEDGIYPHILRTQQPLSIPDVSQRPDWQYVDSVPPAHSWLGVPLIHAGQVIGMLSLARETVHPFSDQEVVLATAFAGQAAIALRNARLFDTLKRAYDQLERLDRAKSNFVNLASHELRTPLVLVTTSSEILLGLDGIQKDPEAREMVASIARGGKRLQEIVTGLISMAEIQNGLLQLVPVRLAPAQLLHLVADSFRPALEERCLTIELSGLDALPAIEADFDGLVKVFYQLLINAIKYTPDGGKITVSGRLRAEGEAGLEDEGIEIVVSDTGIGIDPYDQEAIFTKFYQTREISLHSTGNTQFKSGGPGLGLAVARGLVEAHGGRLWVESAGYDEERCPGSHFHVALLCRPRLAQDSFANLSHLNLRAPFATTQKAMRR